MKPLYAALFNESGQELTLLDAGKLIGRTSSRRFLRKQFPMNGNFWFVWDCSDDPADKRGSGFYSIWIYESNDAPGGRGLSHVLNDASYPHFDVERAIGSFDGSSAITPIMPDNVQAIVRERVRYREGTELHTEDEDRFSVQTRSADQLADRIGKLTSHDATELGKQVGGRRVPIFELSLAMEFFTSENEIEDEFTLLACIYAAVPWRHKLRLWRLMRRLKGQLAAE